MKANESKDGRVFEVMRGKRRADMSEAQFLEIIQTTAPHVAKLPGLLSRRVLIDGDTCVDIVEWESREAVEAAMQTVMTDPGCAPLMALFPEADMEMLHLTPVLES